MIKFWFLGWNDAIYDVITHKIFFETCLRFFSNLHVSTLFREAKNIDILKNFCSSKKSFFKKTHISTLWRHWWRHNRYLEGWNSLLRLFIVAVPLVNYCFIPKYEFWEQKLDKKKLIFKKLYFLPLWRHKLGRSKKHVYLNFFKSRFFDFLWWYLTVKKGFIPLQNIKH